MTAIVYSALGTTDHEIRALLLPSYASSTLQFVPQVKSKSENPRPYIEWENAEQSEKIVLPVTWTQSYRAQSVHQGSLFVLLPKEN